MEACQRELHAHSEDDQPHKPRHHVVQKAASAPYAGSAADHEYHNGPHYNRGYHDSGECGDRQCQLRMHNSERDTSVIVPGLANRIIGVSDRFLSSAVLRGALSLR